MTGEESSATPIYGVEERNFLEVAQLGLSVPGLITGGFKVSKSTTRRRAVMQTDEPRSVTDYVAWTF